MRTLTLLGIFIVLVVTAFKQPGQSFPDAAAVTGNRILAVVSDFTGDSRPVNETPAPPPAGDTKSKQKTEVTKLENFRPEAPEALKKRDAPSRTWVIPPSKLEPGPAPERAPLRDVEISVLTDPSAVRGSGETETPAAGDGGRDSHEEVARLLEEASRNLSEIK